MRRVDIGLLRRIDRAFGLPLTGLLSAGIAQRPRGRLSRVLVIKLFGLGNIVMLAPAVQALHSAFPGLRVDLLTFAPNAGGAALYRRLYRRAYLLRYSMATLPVDLVTFVQRRRNRYDLVIDAEQFIRLAGLMALLLRPHFTAGIPTPDSGKARAFTVHIPYREDRPLAREYLDLAEAVAAAFGRKADVPDGLVAPDHDPDADAKAADLLSALPKDGRRIGVCVGGRADAMLKRYPRDDWHRLLERIVKDDPKAHLVFTGTPSETAEVRAVTAGLPRCLDLSGRMTQVELAAVLRSMDTVLSNDTGTLHLAAATGTRTAGFFGPTDPTVYAPYTGNCLVIHDPRNVPQITNRSEKRHEGAPVYWPTPDEAFERLRPWLRDRA